MLGKMKSECSSQTMISVPPFLTKRNLLQTNIFRSQVSSPSHLVAQESCLNDAPKRCPPELSIVRSSKPVGDTLQNKASNNSNKTKQKAFVEHTSWGWSEDKPWSKVNFSANLGNVNGDGRKLSARNSKQSPPADFSGCCGRSSEDKMASTDDDSLFVECETNVTSAENDFRDDSPVNYSRLNAALEKEGSRLNPKSTHRIPVGDTLQRFCAGISHDSSSPFNTSLAFCKTGIKSDNVIRNDDPVVKSRLVNPSTSTNTYLNAVAPSPADGLKKLDRSLDGVNVSTTAQPYKTRHSKRKSSVPLDYHCHAGDEISSKVHRSKRDHKERKPQDNLGRDEGNLSGFSSKEEEDDDRVREMNNYNKSRMGPVKKVLNVARDEAVTVARYPSSFYDVLDCKSKDVEELFNFQSSFETASSGASQASFRSAMDGKNLGLHSESRRFGSKSPLALSRTSSPLASHRNSSFKFDPDVFKSTFSVSLEGDSPKASDMTSLLTEETRKFSRNTNAMMMMNNNNNNLNSSADKMGKSIDTYRPSQNRIKPQGYQLANEKDEYLFQLSSPKDVLMMSLQSFKGLNISDERSRTDCEKYLGHKATGEKLNNFIRSRTIFNSMSFVQTESFPRDDVNLSDGGSGLGRMDKMEDAGSANRPGQRILQCIYKSQHF